MCAGFALSPVFFAVRLLLHTALSSFCPDLVSCSVLFEPFDILYTRESILMNARGGKSVPVQERGLSSFLLIE